MNGNKINSQLIVMMFLRVMDSDLDISCYPTTKTKTRKENPFCPKLTSTSYLIPRNAPPL